MTNKCPRCGKPVEHYVIGRQTITVERNDKDGNVLPTGDGAAMFLDGNTLLLARRSRIPLYYRHGIKCWRTANA